MNGIIRGFRIFGKSFLFIIKDKVALLYMILVSILTASFFVLLAFYTKQVKGHIDISLLQHFNLISLFGMLFAILFIYLTGKRLAVKKKPHLSISVLFWLFVWFAAKYAVGTFLSTLGGIYVVLASVIGLLGYYVSIAIIIDGTNPLRAIASSIKALRTTFLEVIGLTIASILTAVLGLAGIWLIYNFLPFLAILVGPRNFFVGPLPMVIMTLLFSLASILLFFIGAGLLVSNTILYLSFKKDLSPSFGKK